MADTTKTRIITRTMETMAAKSHLPGDLVQLTGRTALLQAQEGQGLDLDLSGLNLSGPDQGPLCPPDQLPLDRVHFRSMAVNILDLILDKSLDMPPAMTQAAGTLKSALKTGDLDLEGAFRETAAGFGPNSDPGPRPNPVLNRWADQTTGAPLALPFLVMAAAGPGLEAAALALSEAAGLDREKVRPQGSCPVCGSLPYMLELTGKEGQRFAHCPCCRHSYRIRRLACPCCNTDNTDQLKYFTADGETGFRVDTCTRCSTYIKTIDFRELDREAFAPLNDLESMPLDILATNQGFERMAPSVWAI